MERITTGLDAIQRAIERLPIAIDRREKSLAYHAIASIEEYVLAAQDEPRLIIHERCSRWAARTVEGLDAVAELKSIGFEVPLRQIYDEVLG